MIRHFLLYFTCAVSIIFPKAPARIEANLTPMIDVTFLLIVFFVLVSQIVDVETVEIDLPRPDQPASILPGDQQRAVVNVIPRSGGEVAAYRLGETNFAPTPQGLEQLTDTLAGRYRSTPSMRVNVRADRATHYRHVQPVLDAARRAAGLSGQSRARVNLVVVREQ